MSDLITVYIPPSHKNKCIGDHEKIGKHLYKQNENYRAIVNCMEHPEFRKLFDDHFSTLDDLKNILLFLKLYREIEKFSPVELNGYQKLSILDDIIKDRKLRREICKEVTNQTRYLSDKLL